MTRRVYFDFRHVMPIDNALRQRLKQQGYVKEGLLTDDDVAEGVVNLTAFRCYADRYLAQHRDVNAEMLYMVRQLESTPTGLPVEFYFFLNDKEWKTYEMKMAEILEHFYAVIPDFGLRIYQQNMFF